MVRKRRGIRTHHVHNARMGGRLADPGEWWMARQEVSEGMTPAEAVTATYERFGRTEADYLLQRFGVSRLPDLPPDLIEPFVEFAQATLIFNMPPSSPWANGVPMEYVIL